MGALGILTQIQGGKISIKSPKVVVNKGEKISEGAASVMNKLEIKPFSVGFEPLAAFDTKENKLYSEIKIDKEETLEQLKELFARALAFAVEVNYTSSDTIKYLIGKAGSYGKALEKFIDVNANQSQEKTEHSSEENK